MWQACGDNRKRSLLEPPLSARVHFSLSAFQLHSPSLSGFSRSTALPNRVHATMHAQRRTTYRM